MGVVKLYAFVQSYVTPVTEYTDAYYACMSFIRLISTVLYSCFNDLSFHVVFRVDLLMDIQQASKNSFLSHKFQLSITFFTLNDERVGMSGRNSLLFSKVRRQGSLIDAERTYFKFITLLHEDRS